MELIRTSTPGSAGNSMGLRGVYPGTMGCGGPRPSNHHGMDAPCCARCNVIRKQVQMLPSFSQEGRHDDPSGYALPNIGSYTENATTLEYLDRLAISGIIRDDVFSCCVISLCGGRPNIFIPAGGPGLGRYNVSECVRLQLELWEEMGLSDEITSANIGRTHNGVPIIVPVETTVQTRRPSSDVQHFIEPPSPVRLSSHEEVMKLLFRR